jgi:hypothetical protein
LKISEGKLPVASAATVAATASAAAASTTTAAMSTTASATTAAMTATASATPATLTLRASFVDDKRASEKILPVERSDGFFGFGVVMNFGESEPARLTCEAIAKKRERIRLHADFREQCGYLLFRGLERQISNVQFLHGRSPCAPFQVAGHPREAERQDHGRGQSEANRHTPAEASAPATQKHLAASVSRSQ